MLLEAARALALFHEQIRAFHVSGSAQAFQKSQKGRGADGSLGPRIQPSDAPDLRDTWLLAAVLLLRSYTVYI